MKRAPSQVSAAGTPPPVDADYSRRVIKARHDLRNPLGHIMGFAELLLEVARKEERPDLRTDLDMIYELSEQIVLRINNCLDPRDLPGNARMLPLLEKELATFSESVVQATDRLREQLPAAASDNWVTDLDRIANSAHRLGEITPNSLSGLRSSPLEPAPPETSPASNIFSPSDLVHVEPGLRAWRDGVVVVVTPDREIGRSLTQLMSARGYNSKVAASGSEALAAPAHVTVDLFLLDLSLPRREALDTLEKLQHADETKRIPVLLLCGATDADTAVKALDQGASDFLPKPLEGPVVLARVAAALAQKRLHDQERALLQRVQVEQERSERLLGNILPESVALRLKHGEKVIAQHVPEATVVLATIADFARLAAELAPAELLGTLNELYEKFDYVCEALAAEKVKTAIDSYMALTGLGEEPGHHHVAGELALGWHKEIARLQTRGAWSPQFRISMVTGPLAGGLVGTRRFTYDVWGPTIELARELQLAAHPGAIVTDMETYERLQGAFRFEQKGGAARPKDKRSHCVLLGKGE